MFIYSCKIIVRICKKLESLASREKVEELKDHDREKESWESEKSRSELARKDKMEGK